MAMLRGLGFVCLDMNVYLRLLDMLIDISKPVWIIDDLDLNHYEFTPGRYSGLAFRNAFAQLSELSFMRIRQYSADASVEAIDTYEDFVKSDCELLILFIDGGDYEVYAKDTDLIQKLFQGCIDNGFERVESKDDATDGRYAMHF